MYILTSKCALSEHVELKLVSLFSQIGKMHDKNGAEVEVLLRANSGLGA